MSRRACSTVSIAITTMIRRVYKFSRSVATARPGTRRWRGSATAAFGVALWSGVLVTTPVLAQDPPTPPPLPPDSAITMICKKACDVVSGTVYDSLADQSLGGAFVVAMPTGVSATADSLGRFVIASDGLVEQLTVYHSVLDQLGLGALTALRPDSGQAWNRFRIAIPSLPTIWTRLCSTPRPLYARGVILAGTVRLADNVTRVSGARVIAQWRNPERGVDNLIARWRTGASAADREEFGTAETISDSTGGFAICGAADLVESSLIALSSEVESGVVTLPPDPRPLRRVDLVVARTGATPTTVRGKVVNEWSVPIAGIRVSIDGNERETTTDASGAFRLVNVPPGSRMLSARALGFPPVMQLVHVIEGEMDIVHVPMSRPYSLGSMALSPADTLRDARREFELRRRTGSSIILDSASLARASDLRAALRMFPNLSVTEFVIRATPQQSLADRATLPDGAPTSSPPLFEVRGPGRCVLPMYVDGRWDRDQTVLSMKKSVFAAIELRRTPPELLAKNEAPGCGRLFFWTPHGLRP